MKNRLKVFRAMHDLTQEDLADKLGVTRQTINAIEKQRYNPSLELAFKLADFFGVTIEELFIRDSPEDLAEPDGSAVTHIPAQDDQSDGDRHGKPADKPGPVLW